MKVSIIMLVYNAPCFVRKSILSLSKTKSIDYELIVVDNNSSWITKKLLKYYKNKGLIDKLVTNKENLLFAGGNNVGARCSNNGSDYLLLLNSDILVVNPLWLKKLVDIHPTEGGVSSYGVVLDPPKRADGYCFLVNRDLYMNYMLDENFQWFWGITKLQSQILKDNKRIVCVENHENMIHHYGGRSGKGFKDAKGMGIDIEEVKKWFTCGEIEVINSID